jgi:hypothetical protein
MCRLTKPHFFRAVTEKERWDAIKMLPFSPSPPCLPASVAMNVFNYSRILPRQYINPPTKMKPAAPPITFALNRHG